MTGVDPRIPIKPHTSPNIELSGQRSPNGWGDRPLNFCKLITINQALFVERGQGLVKFRGPLPATLSTLPAVSALAARRTLPVLSTFFTLFIRSTLPRRGRPPDCSRSTVRAQISAASVRRTKGRDQPNPTNQRRSRNRACRRTGRRRRRRRRRERNVSVGGIRSRGSYNADTKSEYKRQKSVHEKANNRDFATGNP